MLINIFMDNFDLSNNVNNFFDVTSERNLPTWYSSAALLFCSTMLGIIAKFKSSVDDPFRRQWAVLSVIFLLMSFDEIASIHEKAIKPTREALNVSGFLYFAWVIPAGIRVILLGLYFLRFMTHLDRQTRNLFLISAAVFLSGAILFEMIGASLYEDYKSGASSGIAYDKVAEVEEFFEMSGIVIFIYALLAYIRKIYKGIDIRIDVE